VRTVTFRYLLLPVLLFVALATDIDADDHGLYREAHNLLNRGLYAEAWRVFSELSNYGTDIQMAAAYQYYAAKAGYHAGYLDEGLRGFNHLINRFPKSSYIPYGYFFAGNIYYRQGHTDKAVTSYVNAFKVSTDSRLDRLVIESLSGIASSAPPVVLENLALGSLEADRRCELLLPLARELIEKSNFQPVKSILTDCDSPEIGRVIEQAGRLLSQKIEIGILLPLSGELQKFGESLLDGIRLMIDKYTRETGQELTPVVYDTQGDRLEAARIVRRMLSSGVAAAIGPLTSEEAAVGSAVLACGDLPLIIPAATEAGLTELSSTSYQLQPNLGMQGIRMADFAIDRLGADTTGILTPTAPENLQMARAFAKRFENRGGTVLGVEYFRTRETDFGPFLKDIKSQIVGQLLDSIVFINETGDTIEAEAVPVELDCLYIPADAGQLRMLLPQIDFYNLHTVYLGGDGWSSDIVYRLGEDVTKSCYFTSGRVESGMGDRAQQFMTEFDIKYGRQPGHLESLGYDAMALICEALRSGQYSRSEISHYLSTISDYEGATGFVSFGENHENVELPIYTIENGVPKEAEF